MTSSTELVALSSEQFECLRLIVGHMIPASEKHGLPGADDPKIMADMATTIGRDRDALSAILNIVNAAAGGHLGDLHTAEQRDLLADLRLRDSALFGVIEAVASRAYYRDDRVLKSIGVEPRAPFPQGYVVDEGDWSLLDPVRRRGPIYRDAG